MLSKFKYISLDVSSVNQIDEHINVVIVEFENIYKQELDIQKIIITKIKDILSNNNILIFFFVTDEYNIRVLNIAYQLKVASIFKKNETPDSIIQQIEKQHINNKKQDIYQVLGKQLVEEKAFIIIEANNTIYYANEAFMKTFNCSTLDDVNQKVYSKLNLLLIPTEEKITSTQSLHVNQIEKNFDIQCIYRSEHQKYIIFFNEKFSYTQGERFIFSKIDFIDILQQTNQKNIHTAIVSLRLENLLNLNEDYGFLEIEKLLTDILFEIKLYTENYIAAFESQNSTYNILFEIQEENQIDAIANHTYDITLNFLEKKSITQFFEIFAFYINSIFIDSIFETIVQISKNELNKKKIEEKEILYISNLPDSMSEKDIIDSNLTNVFINKKSIKLLTQYKGMHLYGISKIIKKTDSLIYIFFNKNQGAIIERTKKLTLQSSYFQNDISCNLRYIDNQKGVAILNNFSFLDDSVNSRKFTRVICSRRTPAFIVGTSGSFNAEILDLSINSANIKTKNIKNINQFLDKFVTILFTLPTDLNHDGYKRVKIESKIIKICQEKDNYITIVLKFNEYKGSKDTIIEYIHKRQKEIISELNRLTDKKILISKSSHKNSILRIKQDLLHAK